MSDSALEKRASTLPAAPEFIEDSSWGLDEIGLRDMILPRLKLCQNNTPARDKNSKDFIKGLEEGWFFNSFTKEMFKESIKIVPLFFFKSRIMFRDMKEGGGIICQAPDGVSCQMNNAGPCLHQNFGPKGEPPECTEIFNYPALIYRGTTKDLTKELVIVSMKTTGLKAGRNLNSLMRLRGKAPYAGVYVLTAVPDRNKAGQNYYTWEADNVDPYWVTDTELFAHAKKTAETVFAGLKSGRIQVQELSEDEAAFANRDSEV